MAIDSTKMPANTNVTWELPRVGEVIAGKYRILGGLGRGGVAAVFRAADAELERTVAVKVLLPEWADDPDVGACFVREGRAARRIKSDHVIRVLDGGTAESGAPFLVVECLDGTDLDALLKRDGPLSVKRAVDYVLQACEAIGEAHASGIVHCDLKPANLFVTTLANGSDGLKVLDFGISKLLTPSAAEAELSHPSIVMGSPEHMSPEQLVSTANVDERSDLWALGAILYELLVGRPPYRGDTGRAGHAEGGALRGGGPAPIAAVRRDVAFALEASILMCLDGDASRRFANVAELAFAIAKFGTPATARASATRTLRVLQAAGLVPSARDRLLRGLGGEAKADMPTAQTGGGGAPEEEYRIRKHRPVLTTILTMAVVVAVFGSGAALFVRESVPNRAHSKRLPASVQAAVPTATVAARPPSEPPAAETPSVRPSSEQADRASVPTQPRAAESRKIPPRSPNLGHRAAPPIPAPAAPPAPNSDKVFEDRK